MDQRVLPLSEDDQAEIVAKRKWVLGHYAAGSTQEYESLEGKLGLLDTILRNRWIDPGETLKLQCLGVTFGDALVQRLGLRWVAIEDEFGHDPALVAERTTIKVFPLTMISKRIEAGETVDVRDLFRRACGTIECLRAEEGSRDPGLADRMASSSVLVAALLTIRSSYARNIEEPHEGVPDTAQFWFTRDQDWRVRTYAMDHDIHVHLIRESGQARSLSVPEAIEHLRKHYEEVIERVAVLEFPDPADDGAVARILAASHLTGQLEVGTSGVAFLNPDGGSYRTQSTP